VLPDKKTIASLLAFEISPEVIQACLIAREEGIYRLAGVSRVPTSLNAQGTIHRKCLSQALHNLTNTSGHELLADNGNVITPSDGATRGVDRICLSWSLPAPIKVILLGLMPSGSLKAGSLLVEELPFEIVDQICATDGSSDEDRLDVILSKRPDLIVICGGVEDGADLILRSSVDLVARSISILPPELRPMVLYAGNSLVAEYVKSKLEPMTLIFTGPNIQPTLSELDIQPAREVLSDVYDRIWVRKFEFQIGSRPLVINQIRPSIRAVEDLLVMLGISQECKQGGIAIQLNGLTTSLSVSRDGRSTSFQITNECMLADPGKLVNQYEVSDLAPWIADPVDSTQLAEYLAAESLYAGRLPTTSKEDALEEGLTRLAGIRTWHSLINKHDFPKELATPDYCADVDIALITGRWQEHHREYGLRLLQLLDILQPVGLCDVFIDQDGIAASLGTMAHLNPSIPLHCLSGQAVPRLATIIAPVHKARDGARLLSMMVVGQEGIETKVEIPAGGISSIPLPPGKKAELTVNLFGGAKLGARFNAREKVTIEGSLFGIVIDARGRPLIPRKDPIAQLEWMKNSKQQILGLAR
jgi:hypothetical protein